MKYLPLLIIGALVLGSLAGVFTQTSAYASSNIPTFSISSVIKDQSVTIKTFNFPANDTFRVLMGKMGTKGVNGIQVATTNSGSGGTFTQTYNIPASLQGQYQIAIRLESTTGSSYYAYNWFYNNSTAVASPTPGPSPTPGYAGYPTFSIVSVARDQSVTIKTKNLPANDTFDVLLGRMGTKGINGIKVATTNSGAGGALELTYAIPAALKGLYQIAIRLQSNTGSGYYAYNWFYNNTTAIASPTPGPSPTPGYTGFPTFSIVSVVRNTSVTIKTKNLPSNDSFNVLMGAMGTQGINGIKVATTDSGSGGTQTFTYTIPAALKDSYRIAIRLQSNTGSGYYAYNWFYNNTTP